MSFQRQRHHCLLHMLRDAKLEGCTILQKCQIHVIVLQETYSRKAQFMTCIHAWYTCMAHAALLGDYAVLYSLVLCCTVLQRC